MTEGKEAMISELEKLYSSQLETFELARKNYAGLKDVVYRTIPFGLFDLRLQYNPGRMLSTNAKTGRADIQSRKCFLCREHLPQQQQGILYGEQYHIYVNPYPIFEKHFTVPASRHTPQLIAGRFTDMLNLAFDLPGYTLFYNGPQCGASAPDHFHFQIAPRHAMPLEQDSGNEQLRHILVHTHFYSIATLQHYLREVIILKASDQQQLIRLFTAVWAIIGEEVPYEEEPMANLLAWFDNCQWTVCLFPRRARRPWQFFAEGHEKVLFSPGCVDMAGLIIVPRQEDFEKYTASLLTGLFEQVSVHSEAWHNITKRIKMIP